MAHRKKKTVKKRALVCKKRVGRELKLALKEGMPATEARAEAHYQLKNCLAGMRVIGRGGWDWDWTK